MKSRPTKYPPRFQKHENPKKPARFDRPSDKPAVPLDKPELLAPAGRAETFFAALDAGADAVYVGIQDFNARMRAPNFTIEELSPLVSFAHDRGKKVYVALNTLVKERELPDLVRVLDALRRIGPDALIVQDLGVCRLARELAPEIPLHASTQMTIHNLDGALQAQRMGFERVILARELTIEEIRAIRSSSTIGLETFIHGALCFSISGQCLFSSYVHGKSANRGRCMQPCRREFEYGGKEAAFFSTYDLNTAAILDQLIAAGIRAFKIEGRLKPSETIAQIVRAYRILIDAYPRLSREAVSAARRALDVAVGRAPSTGFYLSPRPDRVVSGASHAARDLGVALAAGAQRFGLVSSHSVKTGDRLRVQVSEKETPRGFVVRQMFAEGMVMRRSRPGQRVDIAAPFDVPAGARVFKVADTDALVKGATKRYEKSHAAATTPARAAFHARFFQLDKRSVRMETSVGAEKLCTDWPLTWKGSTSIAEAAAILGAASFEFDVKLAVDSGKFETPDLPLSTGDLEAFRNKTLARISDAMNDQRDRLLQRIVERPELPANRPSVGANIVRVRTVEDALAVFDALDEQASGTTLVIPLAQIETDEFRVMRARKDVFASVMLALPQFVFVAEKRVEVAAQLRRALDLGVNRFEVSNPAHFNLLHATGRRRLHVLSAPGIGCMNSQCLRQLREIGVTVATYSIEADEENLHDMLAHIRPDELAVQAYGYAPLFQTRAPRKQLPSGRVRLLEPEKRLVVKSVNDVTFVIPEEPFFVCDRIEDLRANGMDSFVYDLFFAEDPAAVLRTCLETDRRGALGASAFNLERGLS